MKGEGPVKGSLEEEEIEEEWGHQLGRFLEGQELGH